MRAYRYTEREGEKKDSERGGQRGQERERGSNPLFPMASSRPATSAVFHLRSHQRRAIKVLAARGGSKIIRHMDHASNELPHTLTIQVIVESISFPISAPASVGQLKCSLSRETEKERVFVCDRESERESPREKQSHQERKRERESHLGRERVTKRERKRERQRETQQGIERERERGGSEAHVLPARQK